MLGKSWQNVEKTYYRVNLMSQCLHCGDCCLRMSPFDSPNPCRYLKKKTIFISAPFMTEDQKNVENKISLRYYAQLEQAN
jgi:hypothetical protein